MNDNQYFKYYFTETSEVDGYDDTVTKEDNQGRLHVYEYNFTNRDLIKIFQSFSKRNKKKVRTMMVRIDFRNGNMQNYIDYIMKGYLKLQRGEKL